MWFDRAGGIVVLLLLLVITTIMLDIYRINRGSNPCGSSNDHHHPAFADTVSQCETDLRKRADKAEFETLNEMALTAAARCERAAAVWRPQRARRVAAARRTADVRWVLLAS